MKPDATLKNMNTELSRLSGNLTAIKTKSGSNLKIIADKEVQNAKELAQQLAKINQEKSNQITKTQNDYAKGLSGQLRENGNVKAADTLDKQIALSEQEKSNKEAMLALDEEIAAKARTNNAYSSEQISTMRGQIQALNGLNIEGINSKFDTMKQSLKSVRESLQSSLGDAFKGLISGTQSLGQAFKGLVSSMLSNLASLAANSLMKDLFGGGGSAGGIGGLLAGIFGGGQKQSNSSGGVSSILGGGSGLGNLVGSLFHFSEGAYINKTIPNFAMGSPISQAMNKERSQSGKNPMLAVVNDSELILSAVQSEKFMSLGLDKILGSNIRNFSSGNLPDFTSSSSSSNSQTINIPITVNAASDGSKPQLDVTKLRDAVKNIVVQTINDSKRNGGQLSNG